MTDVIERPTLKSIIAGTRLSTLFLLIALAVVAGSLVKDVIVGPAIKRAMYDDGPPIRFLQARLQETILQPGQPISFAFSYTKRADCHPPLAPPGLVRSRIWWADRKKYVWTGEENLSYAGPSVTPVERPFRAIQIPRLAPGEYFFQWQATYSCASASGPQTVQSPFLPFTVAEEVKNANEKTPQAMGLHSKTP